jgi:hypothetical protein
MRLMKISSLGEYGVRQKLMSTLIKKENEIFLINKEIMGAVEKSYLRKGFLIHVCI